VFFYDFSAMGNCTRRQRYGCCSYPAYYELRVGFCGECCEHFSNGRNGTCCVNSGHACPEVGGARCCRFRGGGV
jgi:hypothetical protein